MAQRRSSRRLPVVSPRRWPASPSCSGLIFGAAWVLRRLNVGASPAGSAIRIIASQALGQRERVVLVEVAEQWLVVGVAPGSVSALATLPKGTLATPPAPAPAFASLLARMRRGDTAAATMKRSAPAARHCAHLLAFALLALVAFAPDALAQGGDLPLFISTPAPGGGQSYSLPVQTLLFLTALSFLPAVLLLMTSFTRIVIVLSLLRQALGTQAAPPNQVLVGLALFLTFFVMAPMIDRIYADAYLPYSEQKLSMAQALDARQRPLRDLHAEADARGRPRAVRAAVARRRRRPARDDVPLQGAGAGLRRPAS